MLLCMARRTVPVGGWPSFRLVSCPAAVPAHGGGDNSCQEDEYMLLGMAIKYAGLRGKEVRVIGENRSTLREEERIQ